MTSSQYFVNINDNMSLFPYKLHQLLTDIDANYPLSSIVSWLPSGKAFQIHQPELFEDILLHKYFPRQTQMKSFKRQLQYYGFDNLGDCIFAHPHFLQGQKHHCGQITHTLPTKSQKAAYATLQPRRVLGKSEKQALRNTVTKMPSQAPKPQPVVALVTPVSSPKSPPALLTSSLQQVLLLGRDKPLQYWDRLNHLAAQQAGVPAPRVSTLWKINNDPLSHQKAYIYHKAATQLIFPSTLQEAVVFNTLAPPSA
jgi:hypothetical protein